MNHYKSKTKEFNLLDSVLTDDVQNNKLVNDVHIKNELKEEIISKQNLEQEPTPVTIASVRGGKKNREIAHDNLRVLIDCGSSNSLIHKKYANALRKSKSIFDTGNGQMSTNFETKMSFTLPEFSDKKIITWNFDVGEDKNLGDYDMIIGRDIQWALKMIIDFKIAHLRWDDIAIPMRDYQKIKKYNFIRKELRMIIQ